MSAGQTCANLAIAAIPEWEVTGEAVCAECGGAYQPEHTAASLPDGLCSDICAYRLGHVRCEHGQWGPCLECGGAA
jgi:hypothetical protein